MRTFQPVVPVVLKYPTENSLCNTQLYAPASFLKDVYNDRILPAFPIYEHNGREKVRANSGLTLSDFAWEQDPVDDGKLPISVFRKTTYLYVIRRNLFQHLAGFPESCAIFALRQYFGNGHEFTNVLDEIKKFIRDTVIASITQDFKDNILAEVLEGVEQTHASEVCNSSDNYSEYMKWSCIQGGSDFADPASPSNESKSGGMNFNRYIPWKKKNLIKFSKINLGLMKY